MDAKVTLFLVVLLSSLASARCFDENTTIETTEFGDQLINVTGCALVGGKVDIPDLLILVPIAVFCFFMVLIIIVILLKVVPH